VKPVVLSRAAGLTSGDWHYGLDHWAGGVNSNFVSPSTITTVRKPERKCTAQAKDQDGDVARDEP
jgi:hypothetical protein